MQNEITKSDAVKIIILAPIATALVFGVIWLAAATVNVFG
jgi:hypothetical protein